MPRSRPPLTRDEILSTALAIVDAQGLEGLSMRKLAAALGVKVMSLYNHVRDRDDLLHGMVDRVLASITQPAENLAWPATLEYFAQSLYGALIVHPALVTEIEQAEPLSGRVLMGMERVLLALKAAGLSPREQVSAFRGLVAVVLGFVLAHTRGLTVSRADAQATWERWDSQQFTGSERPYLIELAPYFQDTRADDDFAFVLQAYLDALRARVHLNDASAKQVDGAVEPARPEV
ncbi:MAG TPA: TetR/AcrR family transcriptional regulator C-terminal domain-containing protein [Kouleothrix sp.]|uniref:TetR/AcrR family transcriptional regulator n=1 Tax=Kouleothrix sp. TaxID=2779161 RepID=UPI002BF15AF3|nr:TetR/AcrR family transcriptional regulator C-terminal domain-containing protein [Kouleothrix sp.]HRC75286.1 TetR/AcrR family transcriptional regulator C-terminal domain-containing protein [Kouleothrix sp.]